MKVLVFVIAIFALVAGVQAQNALSASSVTEFNVGAMKVLVKQRKGSPTVAVGLVTRGGVRNQTAENAGIENLTWNVATEGSKKFPRAVLRKELAKTGTSITGAAGYDLGGLSMISTSQNFGRSWEILTDLALNPTFNDADLNQVRETTIAALRNRTASPESALVTLEEQVVFAGHPYAVSPSGTIETVSRFTAADLRAFHARMMQQSRLVLVVVGDTEPEQIRKLATAAFGTLPKGDYVEQAVPSLNFAKGTVNVTERAVNTNYIKGVFAAPPPSSPDYYAMRVAVALLATRLFEEVRVKRNLSYAPNADIGSNAANTAHIYVTATDPNQTIGVMLQEIDKLRKNAPDEDDFVGVSGFFLTKYYVDHETNAAQAGELARYETIGGGWRRSFEFLEGIKRVTAEDVRRAANKYMKDIRFVVIGDPKAINNQVFLGAAN
jgi:zinc protease